MRRTRQLIIGGLVVLNAIGLAKSFGLKSSAMSLVRTEVSPLNYTLPVSSSFPNDGAFDVGLNSEVTAQLKPTSGGIDTKTVNESTVMLVRTADQTQVDASVKLSGNTITLRPEKPLNPATNYTFYLTGGVRHRSGAPVIPFASAFTTIKSHASPARFEKVMLPAATGTGFTGVAMGPDGKLWACSDDGRFFRFPISGDGTLGGPQVIDSLHKHNNGPRLTIGFCFDRASTASHPIIWVCNSAFTFNNAPDFSGKVTRLAGANLEDVGDVVTHLPRSVRDHMTNQPAIGPDGALYFPQGSSSSFGAPDEIWGMRIEHLLTATVLRLDLSKVTPGAPINSLTPDAGGSYDPRSTGAPLTIFATGVRNAFSLVWHSNGHLYVPVNGSSAGGHTPASPDAPPVRDISIAEDDWLFRIAPGKYHGHPNPFQGHYILNGGNPTAEYDFAEVCQYPVGTQPDPNWTPAVYDFGKHVSANGVIEYTSSAFGGRFKGKLMVCRYNVGSDIIVLSLDANGNVVGEEFGIPGASELINPLDLCEDPRTGNIYVSEYGALRLTLLRPVSAN